jgi:hypothetical protein
VAHAAEDHQRRIEDGKTQHHDRDQEGHLDEVLELQPDAHESQQEPDEQ